MMFLSVWEPGRPRNQASTRGGGFRALLFAALGAVVLYQSGTVRADTGQPVALGWARGHDADTCPSSTEIEERVARRLGYAPFAPDAPRTIEAIVERRESRWVARIHIRDQHGRTEATRELTSEATDCSAIQDAAVLAIAIAIDPNAPLLNGTRATEPATAMAPPTPPVPADSPSFGPQVLDSVSAAGTAVSALRSEPTLAAARPAAVARARLPASLTLRGGLSGGLVPGTSPAAAWVGTLPVAASWSLAAQSLLVGESAAPDARFEFTLTAFGLGSCYQTSGSWSAGLCASAWLGSLGAVVHTVPPTRPGGRTFSAASCEAFVRFELAGPLHIELAGDVFAPIQRREFTVTGLEDPVWRQPLVAGVMFLGLGIHNL